jgi:hypothetical protein
MKTQVRDVRGQRGQTLLIVVVAMSVLVGMAALAIDIATLYTASNETRRTAEAAALAGAQAFVTSGVTAGWLPQSTVCSSSVGSPWLAEQRALQVVANNTVAGGAATLRATSCNFGNAANPQFSVTVERTGLPTFFGRIWGSFPGSVKATAKAEAYNPSGTTGPPINVANVKPWAVPNCDPTNAGPLNASCGPGGAYFVNPSSGIANSGSIVGNIVDLTEVRDNGTVTTWATATSPPSPPPPPAGNVNFLAVDIPITAATASCPTPTQFSCNPNPPVILRPATPGFGETIACANSTPLSCGQTLTVHAGSGNSTPHITDESAGLCLIHADRTGTNRGQDTFCNNASSPACAIGSPISIDGGDNNPDPGLRTSSNISRSDSVVTVPIFNPCGVACTNGNVTIIGFLQLGVARVRNAGPLRTIVMNVVGCGSTTGTNPVSGGGVSPIPVRLVQ